MENPQDSILRLLFKMSKEEYIATFSFVFYSGSKWKKGRCCFSHPQQNYSRLNDLTTPCTLEGAFQQAVKESV